MNLRYLVVSAALIAVATPALAVEHYLAKDTATGKCVIVTEKPDGTKLVMIGTATYPSKEEAKAAKKASADCPKKKKDGTAATEAPAASDESANKDAPANPDAPPAQ